MIEYLKGKSERANGKSNEGDFFNKSSSTHLPFSFYPLLLSKYSILNIKFLYNNPSKRNELIDKIKKLIQEDGKTIVFNYDWVDVVLSPNPNLTVVTTYWIVLDGSIGSASIKYIIGANLDTNYDANYVRI